MKKMTFKDFKNGKGFFDTYLRDDDIKLLTDEGLKDDDIIINFAYTDYGGDFSDRVFIEYFSNKKYSNCFHSHNTVYYGKNGILWGDVAKEFSEASANYLLGFNDIEDFYFECERKAQEKQAQDYLNDYKDDDNNKLSEHAKNCIFGTICDKLSEHAILSSGVIDICESELDEVLWEYLDNGYKIELSIERERVANSQYYDIIK